MDTESGRPSRRSETSRLQEALTFGAAGRNVQEAFTVLDKNDDGLVDISEITRVISASQEDGGTTDHGAADASAGNLGMASLYEQWPAARVTWVYEKFAASKSGLDQTNFERMLQYLNDGEPVHEELTLAWSSFGRLEEINSALETALESKESELAAAQEELRRARAEIREREEKELADAAKHNDDSKLPPVLRSFVPLAKNADVLTLGDELKKQEELVAQSPADDSAKNSLRAAVEQMQARCSISRVFVATAQVVGGGECGAIRD